MHRLGQEFTPGTNPYKVTTESEKAFDINSSELMTSDGLKDWWRNDQLRGDSQIQVVQPLNWVWQDCGCGAYTQYLWGSGIFPVQQALPVTAHRPDNQCPLSSDCLLTPALVELQERTGTPLFLHGCQGSQLRSSSLQTFPTESFPRLKWVLFSKKVSQF